VTPINKTVHPPTSSLCGSKPLTIDYLSAYDTPWQKISYAEFQKQAAECPNVKTSYLSASDSTQQSVANIQGAASQGVNGIVIYPVAGEPELPAMKQAYASGLSVVPFDNLDAGTPGQDYTTYVGIDLTAAGKAQADALGQALHGKGNVVYLGGPAGTSFTQTVFNGFKGELAAKYPGITILTGGPVATDYSDGNTQQVMAGLFARYPKIDGLMLDYGAAGAGALRAFQAASKPFPDTVALATDNEFGCLWRSAAPKSASLFTMDGMTTLSEIAFRKALAAAAGTNDPESSTVTAFVSADTANGQQPKCDTSLPTAADLNGDLTPAQIAQALK
jgi:ribose transport system substrate-binding protein